ncbi:STAS domain-containing protein [Nitrospira sp. T9]|uniref:STAS domain-containing protein n=1 Tax=unclassified Nitrospira TaxID=2652172 RepID=UPI003F9E4653
MQGELQIPKDFWRLTLRRKFNRVAQKEFEARIQQILLDGYTKLGLDLNPVALISNSGLGQIAMTWLDLKAKGIQVSLAGISPKMVCWTDMNSQIFLALQKSRRLFPSSEVSTIPFCSIPFGQAWKPTHVDQWNFH